MEERKDFLYRLKEMFGDCSRQSFLKKLRIFFDGINKEESLDKGEFKQANEHKAVEDEENSKPLDINGTDAWHNHVETLKDISLLSACLSKYSTLLKKSAMAPFAKSVNNAITEIPAYVDKHFKEPWDITEETSEKIARQTGTFVKDVLWDLLRSCHSGMKHSQDKEKEFYESFESRMEDYLSSIGVYRKAIVPGMDVRKNAKWFETPFIRETTAFGRLGTIDEIEVTPHFIPYLDEDNNIDELILKGVCIAFGEAKKK